ncbi:DUF1799 domain-containing protein [Caenimonas terrae]|uniref:DUF1799 domain-containing protein n=1 Tax=Caenimonas terrae TaxID=696074 RepID=A0ABW0NEZ1_9BURK
MRQGSGGQGKKLREAARLWALGELATPDQQDRTNAHVDEALAAFGLYLEAPVSETLEPFYLWPEHLAAFNFFLELGTQWRVGMDGATGLDYAAVIAHLRMAGNESAETYHEIRALEAGALAAYREMRDRR